MVDDGVATPLGAGFNSDLSAEDSGAGAGAGAGGATAGGAGGAVSSDMLGRGRG